jgi:hypothetical protein
MVPPLIPPLTFPNEYLIDEVFNADFLNSSAIKKAPRSDGRESNPEINL